MSDRNVLIITSRDILSQAKDLATLLSYDGWPATAATGEDGIPVDSTMPTAVIIWAPPIVAYTLFKAARSYFPRKLTHFIVVLPSLESPTTEVDPIHPNHIYLKGSLTTRDILTRTKEILERKRQNTALPVNRVQAQPTRGRVITVFSAKGGVGKTAISTNLAVAIRDATQNRVLLVDGDLQFGDVAVWLGLTPRIGITELLSRGTEVDELAIKSTVQEHQSGLHVLLPPNHPATAERVRPEAVKSLVNLLRDLYDFVVIDTHTSYGDETLAMLDVADDLVVVVTPEISVVRNTHIFLGLSEILGYSDKLLIVLNRANTGIQHNQLPDEIRRLVKAEVVSDGRAVVWSLNSGKPFVQADKSLAVAKGIASLAGLLAGGPAPTPNNGSRHNWWPFVLRDGKRNGQPKVARSR